MTTDLRFDDETALHAQFERDGIWSRMAGPGDRLPDLPLLEADLGAVHLGRLRTTGPLVLVFFRYASSPPCNDALRTYRDELAPQLADLGAHLIAVSAQVPDRLRALKRRLAADFFVTGDVRHTLIDALNIGYAAPGAEVLLGARRCVLPFPATFVADRTGVIRFADVPAESAARTPAAPIIEAVRTLS